MGDIDNNTLTWVAVADGYVALKGQHKIAVLTTKQHQGLIRGGSVIYEPLPVTHWGVHFVNPHVSLEDLQAIAHTCPKEP